MAGSKIVRSFMLIRIVTISGLVFMVGVIALLFFAKMEEQVVAYGTVEPQDATDVRGRKTTTISRVLAEPGDVVAEGDILVKLSSSRVRNDMARAQDQLEKAKVQLAVQQAKLERLRKDPLPEKLRFADEEVSYAKSTLDLSEKELARARKLVADGLMSESQLDAVLTKHNTDVNRSRLAKRKHDLVAAGLEASIVKEAEAQLKLTQREIVNMEREVERLRKDVDKCTIKAPVRGEVVAVYKKDGESLSPGELLLTISSSDRMQLKLFVREEDIYKVGRGQAARIYSSVYSYRKYGICEGEVAEVAKWADAQGAKPAYEVVVSVGDAPFSMPLGSSAMAKIVVARRGILDMLLDHDVAFKGPASPKKAKKG